MAKTNGLQVLEEISGAVASRAARGDSSRLTEAEESKVNKALRALESNKHDADDEVRMANLNQRKAADEFVQGQRIAASLSNVRTNLPRRPAETFHNDQEREVVHRDTRVRPDGAGQPARPNVETHGRPGGNQSPRDPRPTTTNTPASTTTAPDNRQRRGLFTRR